jgi:hypothetical protein
LRKNDSSDKLLKILQDNASSQNAKQINQGKHELLAIHLKEKIEKDLKLEFHEQQKLLISSHQKEMADLNEKF